MDRSVTEDRKARAKNWFEALRDDICKSFEKLEDDAPASLYPASAGRFARTPWEIRQPAPTLGQHNAEVFGKLGMSDARLDELKRKGVI